LSFFLGFIISIGFYPLFYVLNRPKEKWRRIALLAVVILGRPLCLLWEISNLRQVEIHFGLISGAIILDLLTLFACVILGENRLKGFVTAAFVFSISTVAQVPVIYFFALVVQPLLPSPYLVEVSVQIPRLHYFGVFITNIIITCCCFIAFRWLRITQNNPPLKQTVFYCIFSVSFSIVFSFWFIEIAAIASIPYLSTAFFGILLLGMLLMSFYLITKQFSLCEKCEKIEHSQKTLASEYKQFLKNLSRRELEVIEAVLAGNISYKEISEKLNISVNTVKTHLKNIYQITDVSSITALTVLFQGYSQSHPKITPEITPKSP